MAGAARKTEDFDAVLVVEGYMACMRTHGFSAHSPDKGLLGALLAVRSDEDPRLGPGARDQVFDLQRPEFQQLRDFLSGF